MIKFEIKRGILSKKALFMSQNAHMDGRLKAHKIALSFKAYLGVASYPGGTGASSMSHEQEAALEEVQSVIGPALDGLPKSEAVQAFETVRPRLKSAILQNISPEILRQLLG